MYISVSGGKKCYLVGNFSVRTKCKTPYSLLAISINREQQSVGFYFLESAFETKVVASTR